MKPKLDWTNGGTRIAIQISMVVFAAGILWAKVGGLETSIDKLADRIKSIETVLMDKP